MSVTVLSDQIFADRGIRQAVLQDSLGRQKQIQVALIGGPDPTTFIQGEITTFAQEETTLQQQIASFTPLTT